MYKASEFQYIFEMLLAVVIALSMLSLSFFCYKLLHKQRDTLGSLESKEKLSSLYSGIHLYRDYRNIDYMPVFLLRRFVYAFVPVIFMGLPFL